MKIAVYAIAKNEEKFIERFMRSCAGADGIFILDTGSTDRTVEIARAMGATVAQWRGTVWRFDAARNESLTMVPRDYDVCIALDLDEVMPPQWREKVEAAWTPGTTLLRYEFAWSHKPDGSPDLIYWAQKIHARHGYRWVHPVHEVLCYERAIPEAVAFCPMLVHHWPDDTKSRASYLPLLELSVAEDPANDRNAHYLGREYYFHGMMVPAEAELRRHLSLPSATWGPERAASYRYLAKIAKARGDLVQERGHLVSATEEAPGTREPWVELAQAHYDVRDFRGCYHAAKHATGIGPERTKEYLTLDSAWGALPWDLLAISAWNLGFKEEARAAGRESLRFAPQDPRLLANQIWYEGQA